MNATKKYFYFNLIGVVILGGGLYHTKVSATTYLESEKNYYTDSSIDKGFLDRTISQENLTEANWNKFQIAVSKNLISYTPGMTFNQYYLANGISLEDSFTVYPGLTNQLVRLKSGAYLNANTNTKGVKDDLGNVVDYLTYIGPSDDRGPYWGDTELEGPVVFSRLTVGTLPDLDVEGQLSFFPSGTYLFPTQIGYGEKGTVNDYMLTNENDFVIPTRFNTTRNDVYLTMRSRAYFGAGIQGAQAYLNATLNGETVTGSLDNPKVYIDTNSNVYLTSQGYDQLGTFGKFRAPSVYTSASKTMKKIGVNNFSTTMNQGLISIQSNSGANTIVSGNGGQVQLSGFNRQSAIDEDFIANESVRKVDSTSDINVSYYMYTNGNTESNVTTPIAPNGYHLYSPNVSEFKIQTTRPFFKDYGDISKPIDGSLDFDSSIGSGSFSIEDNGVQPDGSSIFTDLNRVRVRVSEDGGEVYSSKSYTLNELKQSLLNKELTSDTLTVAYTYASTDSQDENVGKLPSEISDNTGAYAVPFTRTIKNTKSVLGSDVIVKYTDTQGNSLTPDIKLTGNVGDNYNSEQKSISGYAFKEVQGNTKGTFTDKIQTVTYIYTKDVVKGPDVTVNYVDEQGDIVSKTSGKMSLPQTGTEEKVVLLSLGSILVAFVMVFFIFKKKNKPSNKKQKDS
ncbi:MucBP domain-containing protein [Lactococcus sp. dk322]|uniref:MucBP domain-containing protein n=1 Tax=Lactococcus sp. dk322 TaxID=2603290 RepID=UPI0011CAFCE6|nr:MucBP domain-containing protein [Lactococcus sp. dk322]TXK47390.1 MucBP domain-containing protein [Lactococcus sp. dk322]